MALKFTLLSQRQCAGKGGSRALKVGSSKGRGCCAALEVGSSITAAKGGSRAMKACGSKGSAGKVRFGSGSGPFALNPEPEPRSVWHPNTFEPKCFRPSRQAKISPIKYSSAFEHHPLNANTEPNFAFRFRHSLNLEPERGVQSVRFRFEPIPEQDLATTIERAE
ncbi:hypothetical protein B0H10DRAFT_1946866 [Mycena sp. CBHHK59/15]|nr:hypothetical protein B0H10DRAFT_1946866 [Mycena sp. CBHHK59/15]